MTARCRMSVAIAIALLASGHPLPTRAYASPSSTASARSASNEAVKLAEQIETERENVGALQLRIQLTNQKLFRQRTELFEAESRQRAAETHYRGRLVTLYKSRGFQPIQLLMSSATLPDLFRRASILSRMADQDRKLVAEARLAASDAAYRAQVLESVKTDLNAMSTELNTRVDALEVALKRQRALAKTLNARAKAELDQWEAALKKSRKDWKSRSVPLRATIKFRQATVSPGYETYLAPSHLAVDYRSTGQDFTAICSWYGNEFNGRRTASGQIFNENDFTCASKTLPFGTHLALTRGHYRIIVVVNDRGPFIPGRDLDLSKAAAQALGYSGIETVHAEIVEPLD